LTCFHLAHILIKNQLKEKLLMMEKTKKVEISWTVEELAAACGGRVVGDEQRIVKDIRPLNEATPEDISFLSDPRFAAYLPKTKAGVVILAEEQSDVAYVQIIVENPYAAYAQVATIIAELVCPQNYCGISPGANISDSAIVGNGSSIWPGAFLGLDVVVGERCSVHPGVYLGDDVVIGDDVELFPNVVIYPRSVIGSRVRVHACTVIGNDGFGFAEIEKGKLARIPQIGWVEIGDDVDIGPCSTIHRGALGPTRIGRGSKLDAMVLVAHGVQVGESVRMAGQVGIAGSSKIGKRCVLAGKVGVADHINICDDVIAAGWTGIVGNLSKPGAYMGTPARPIKDARKILVASGKLPEMRKRLRQMEKRLEKLESGKSCSEGT
jgi:UDP-3-O-[3-hydroxymyristoyl] glucosamine N-acyltransferase